MSLLLQLMPLPLAPAHPAWLDAEERARLDGFADARRAAQFLAGHCLVRQLAAQFAGGEPGEWSLRVSVVGRRCLDHAGFPSLFISITHAQSDVVVAVGTGALGVDVEQAGTPRDWLALGRAMFSPEENEALLAASEAARPALFLQAWTLKEAWAKRSGRGLQRTQARRCSAQACDAAQAEAWTWPRPDGGSLALAAWPGARLGALGVDGDPRGWRYAMAPVLIDRAG
ncbi:MAG: 4'-phosphopantetheinyl transferase superfamily protein [Arenimonas sp.]|uniref:4'-phosphopantetheinyl transferase family protein n=1 Tax=Arenimonas sp. TaxID=1872635 RepID=UPI0025B81E0C|nr:4'-phosphopantetheinyl transferase superfamily protein [Arenimonas sp.]MBW8368361.1 4'-phosphopantetheinyl transferase superfamily protein [Arenimonas sp.]